MGKLEKFDPSINIGPIGFNVSDVSALFKAIAEIFSSEKDPDDRIIQEDIKLENEVTINGVWISNNYLRIHHEIKKGLRVVYQYNSEAMARRTSFVNFEQHVNFTKLPDLCECTLFFLARSAVHNKSDHQLENKNAVGFIALFDPAVPQGELIEYNYKQRYKVISPLWGEPAEEINKDYRFLRETKSFTRIFRFPAEHYKDVEPKFYLLDKEKKAKVAWPGKTNFMKHEKDDIVTWTFFLEKPSRDTIFRTSWSRPSK